jgi:hypothetical protein
MTEYTAIHSAIISKFTQDELANLTVELTSLPHERIGFEQEPKETYDELATLVDAAALLLHRMGNDASCIYLCHAHARYRLRSA